MSESQQPSAQPYPPASPYGAPQAAPHGALQQGPPSHGAPAAAKPLGRTAFLVAVATAGLGLLFSMITPFLYTSGNYDVADSLGAVIGILLLLGGIAGSVLAILALRRPAPHLLAAIALGIAGSLVVGRVLTWMSSLLYYFF
ncbi:hypothetical protein RS84_01516 [Microbacterium hydrocarbonoxydans]|uniref:Uncharacterized protein n=1 Tax=Microbacterium hydrocarbonoxydans TaxID=273678 RepID=A0A0M2HTV7_9MICO|nr:hypothetical protein [Microbacterium hydrocarbonoxydans]KJL47888.1 hypothetical protein RS84_01516 [Microbacterium hydrocarbonoxydans]